MENDGWLAREQEKRASKLDILKSTEGWGELEEGQRLMMKLSLWVQDRAVRINEGSFVTLQNGVQMVRREGVIMMAFHDGETGNPEERRYRWSQNHVAAGYCHLAVACLEKGVVTDDERLVDDRFFAANYRRMTEERQLKQAIEEFGFPCVVHIGTSDAVSWGGKMHSMVVMGHGWNGELVVWDKMGSSMPYEVTELGTVWNAYVGMARDEEKKNGYYYGLRKLGTNGKKGN